MVDDFIFTRTNETLYVVFVGDFDDCKKDIFSDMLTNFINQENITNQFLEWLARYDIRIEDHLSNGRFAEDLEILILIKFGCKQIKFI